MLTHPLGLSMEDGVAPASRGHKPFSVKRNGETRVEFNARASQDFSYLLGFIRKEIYNCVVDSSWASMASEHLSWHVKKREAEGIYYCQWRFLPGPSWVECGELSEKIESLCSDFLSLADKSNLFLCRAGKTEKQECYSQSEFRYNSEPISIPICGSIEM